MSDSSRLPDEYERLLGALDGLPGVLSTHPATVQNITPLIGTSQTFIVRTFRQQDRDDEGNTPRATFTVFLEYAAGERLIRLVLPPRVTDLIARQREALTTQARKRTARRIAQERKARGEKPAFLKARKKK